MKPLTHSVNYSVNYTSQHYQSILYTVYQSILYASLQYISITILSVYRLYPGFCMHTTSCHPAIHITADNPSVRQHNPGSCWIMDYPGQLDQRDRSPVHGNALQEGKKGQNEVTANHEARIILGNHSRMTSPEVRERT